MIKNIFLLKKLFILFFVISFAIGQNLYASIALSGSLENGKEYEIIGSSVFIMDSQGNKIPAPDGVYKLKNGMSFTTQNGKLMK